MKTDDTILSHIVSQIKYLNHLVIPEHPTQPPPPPPLPLTHPCPLNISLKSRAPRVLFMLHVWHLNRKSISDIECLVCLDEAFELAVSKVQHPVLKLKVKSIQISVHRQCQIKSLASALQLHFSLYLFWK